MQRWTTIVLDLLPCESLTRQSGTHRILAQDSNNRWGGPNERACVCGRGGRLCSVLRKTKHSTLSSVAVGSCLRQACSIKELNSMPEACSNSKGRGWRPRIGVITDSAAAVQRHILPPLVDRQALVDEKVAHWTTVLSSPSTTPIRRVCHPLPPPQSLFLPLANLSVASFRCLVPKRDLKFGLPFSLCARTPRSGLIPTRVARPTPSLNR